MAQTQQKRKLTRIGQVWESKDSTKENPKYFLKLGNNGNKDPKYDLTVEVTVKNAAGEVVAKTTDGFLTLSDPRKSPFANEAALAKVPNLAFEVLVAQD